MLNRLTEFNRYANTPVTNYHNEMYNLLFNMNILNNLWDIQASQETGEKFKYSGKEHILMVSFVTWKTK